ncbi:glycosyl hydrolase [Aestuariivivens sediminicola]|uniref:glycosyl hydrolase n=1 Tax=Aestuariivivens sediminicola TaxID=2913560 RepID=UPI001F562B44|nr:glycosyl hydrolase [Aestuariivivens sediminicola]
MKKYITLFLLVLAFTSCEKNIIGDFEGVAADPVTSGDGGELISEEAKLTKKGAAYANRTRAWSHKTSALNVHWMYSWGNQLREEIPENVEYVPMFWGKGSVSEENLARVKQYIDEGKVKYVLGFNEPDGADQANMTVDEAIALWPQLETLGVPLGSPAVVGFNNPWLTEFMEKADAQGLRVDFITVHSYGGANVLSFINNIKGVYNTYEKPLWITEFAVADWSATSPESNRYSEAQVMDFMTEVLKALDDIDWVHRYAWFDGSGRNPLYTSALFDEEEDEITSLGQLYADNKPNANIGPGQDTEYIPPIDEDELIVNGGFETGQITPWQGFKNGLYTADTHTGNFAGKLENNDASLFTVTTVEPGSTYILKFWSRWSQTVPNTFKPVLRNNEVSGGAGLLFRVEPGVPMTDQWEETTFEFTVPDGVTQLRVVFYKGKVTPTFPPFYLDDVSLKLKE